MLTCRTGARALTLAVLALLVALATACGGQDIALDDSDEDAGQGDDVAGDPPDDAGKTEGDEYLAVDIVVRADRDAEPVEASYVCDAEGASLSGEQGSDAACAALLDSEEWLREGPPEDQFCTEVFVGPEVAELEGEFVGGERFERELDRADGCGADRWDRLEPALDVE